MNGLYVYLNNRSASQMDGVFGADYVPPTFQPVARHATYDAIAQLLFGRTIQASQYWITRARVMIRNTPFEAYVSLEKRECGYRLEEISQELFSYLEPRLTTGIAADPIGSFDGDDFNVVAYDLVRDNDQILATSVGSGEVASGEIVAGAATVLLVPDAEVGVRIPVDSVPARLHWASRPKNNIVEHMQGLRSQLRPLLAGIAALPSVFSEAEVTALASRVDMTVQRNLGFAAAALLVAGHTAKVAGDTL